MNLGMYRARGVRQGYRDLELRSNLLDGVAPRSSRASNLAPKRAHAGQC
jgi:hypothetical protein